MSRKKVSYNQCFAYFVTYVTFLFYTYIGWIFYKIVIIYNYQLIIRIFYFDVKKICIYKTGFKNATNATFLSKPLIVNGLVCDIIKNKNVTAWHLFLSHNHYMKKKRLHKLQPLLYKLIFPIDPNGQCFTSIYISTQCKLCYLS